MVCTDTESRQNGRPDFVTHGFQVIANAIEPIAGVGHLFAKNNDRETCKYEAPELRPHIIRNRSASSRRRESLAGTASGPYLTVIRPSGEPKRVGPSADACEEMALVEPSQVIWSNKLD